MVSKVEGVIGGGQFLDTVDYNQPDVNRLSGSNLSEFSSALSGFNSFSGVKSPTKAKVSPRVVNTDRSTPENISTPSAPKTPGMSGTDKAKMGLAGAKMLLEIGNAQNAYVTATGQAELNIMMARNQASDALSRGHQAALERQSEGYNMGQQALLSAAARGQEVGGAGVEKIQGSYEAMGVFNGMKEEINSMKEALNYKLEEVGYDYQKANAKIARDNAMIGAVLEGGITAAMLL
jgi:hypothetical protein